MREIQPKEISLSNINVVNESNKEQSTCSVTEYQKRKM